MAMKNNPEFKTKKSLGQNFLQDTEVIANIASACGAGPEDTVVEIGPGLGVLTDALAETGAKVIAVELDDRLIPILRTKFALHPNVEIVHQDILKFDWSKLSGDIRIVGNLPYYITTPILLGILEQNVAAKNITVMVQKEVADRIVASPGGKDFGVLSVSLQYYGKVRRVCDVDRSCFKPAPNVDSAVVELEVGKERSLTKTEEDAFFCLVKKAFSQRRKTLSNSLSGYKGKEKAQIEVALKNIGIDPQRRAETLSVEDYINLSKEL